MACGEEAATHFRQVNLTLSAIHSKNMISSAEKVSILAGLMGVALLRFQTLSESAGPLGINIFLLLAAIVTIIFAWVTLTSIQSNLKRAALLGLIILILAGAVEVIIRMTSFIVAAGFTGTGPLPILAAILCLAGIIEIWLISGIPRKLLSKE